jgi:hypothetical protein
LFIRDLFINRGFSTLVSSIALSSAIRSSIIITSSSEAFSWPRVFLSRPIQPTPTTMPRLLTLLRVSLLCAAAILCAVLNPLVR